MKLKSHLCTASSQESAVKTVCSNSHDTESVWTQSNWRTGNPEN